MNVKINRTFDLRTLCLFALTAVALCFTSPRCSAAPPKASPTVARTEAGMEKATFAAGCFWSMEAIFKQLKGVEKTVPGYAGGKTANPSYEQVETGTTGHAESLDITFDPKVITYSDLLTVLLTTRDPSTPNQQAPDEGPQYRAIIFTHDEAQRAAAMAAIRKINASHVWPGPSVVEIKPFTRFYRAESYHFDYYNQHPTQPYCANVIGPEIASFRARFKSKLKP